MLQPIPNQKPSLTPRTKLVADIAVLMSRELGRRAKSDEIAAKLGLSKGSVQRHLKKSRLLGYTLKLENTVLEKSPSFRNVENVRAG